MANRNLPKDIYIFFYILQETQIQHDPLVQRQSILQKEASTQFNGITANSLSLKQEKMSTLPTKIADLVKGNILFSMSS